MTMSNYYRQMSPRICLLVIVGTKVMCVCVCVCVCVCTHYWASLRRFFVVVVVKRCCYSQDDARKEEGTKHALQAPPSSLILWRINRLSVLAREHHSTCKLCVVVVVCCCFFVVFPRSSQWQNAPHPIRRLMFRTKMGVHSYRCFASTERWRRNRVERKCTRRCAQVSFGLYFFIFFSPSIPYLSGNLFFMTYSYIENSHNIRGYLLVI